MSAKKIGHFSMRIDPDLLEALRKQAERENRNLSNLIETVLIRYLESCRDGG